LVRGLEMNERIQKKMAVVYAKLGLVLSLHGSLNVDREKQEQLIYD
jgi:hypothetical protein